MLARESCLSVWDEALPLALEHHREVGSLPESDFDMNRPLYEKLEAAGISLCFTARDEGELVGYAHLLSMPGTGHYRKLTWATQDVLYVKVGYRGPMSLRFLDYQDLYLAGAGVDIVYRHDTIARPYGRLLLHRGYRLNDRGYVRDLREAA